MSDIGITLKHSGLSFTSAHAYIVDMDSLVTQHTSSVKGDYVAMISYLLDRIYDVNKTIVMLEVMPYSEDPREVCGYSSMVSDEDLPKHIEMLKNYVELLKSYIDIYSFNKKM